MEQQQCELFLGNIQELARALSEPSVQTRYLQALDDELGNIVEPPLRQFNRAQRQRVDLLAQLGFDAYFKRICNNLMNYLPIRLP